VQSPEVLLRVHPRRVYLGMLNGVTRDTVIQWLGTISKDVVVLIPAAGTDMPVPLALSDSHLGLGLQLVGYYHLLLFQGP
jgi:hypothetical protein